MTAVAPDLGNKRSLNYIEKICNKLLFFTLFINATFKPGFYQQRKHKHMQKSAYFSGKQA